MFTKDHSSVNRLANLKSFKPETKNYTGTDRGSINVFDPGLVSTEH